jgi:hypothetical protein
MIFNLRRRGLSSIRLPGGAIAFCTMLYSGPAPAQQSVAAPDRSTPARVAQTARPAGVEANRTPGPGQPAWYWRLTGTLIGPNRREAVFASTAEARTDPPLDGETRSVKEGDQIEGWTLAAIRPRGVTLTAAGAQATLSLEGFSPEEEAAAARVRAIENERRDTAVRAALARQEKELAVAQTEMLAATRKMQAQ